MEWIKLFESLGDRVIQEVYWNSASKNFMMGKRFFYCPVCEGWVDEDDYRHSCSAGYHSNCEMASLDGLTFLREIEES